MTKTVGQFLAALLFALLPVAFIGYVRRGEENRAMAIVGTSEPATPLLMPEPDPLDPAWIPARWEPARLYDETVSRYSFAYVRL